VGAGFELDDFLRAADDVEQQGHAQHSKAQAVGRPVGQRGQLAAQAPEQEEADRQDDRAVAGLIGVPEGVGQLPVGGAEQRGQCEADEAQRQQGLARQRRGRHGRGREAVSTHS
jgi:hypothetical protein